MSDTRRRFLIIYNPAAGRRRRHRLDAVIERLRAAGADTTIVETEAPGHATELARALWYEAGEAEPPDVVVAAGGDGTLAEVAGGLNGGGLVLGLIPLGTANVLARDAGLLPHGRWSAKHVANTLLHADARPLSLGRIRADDKDEAPFVMMAGAGFDGAVVSDLDAKLKRRVGRLAYVWAGLRYFLSGGGEKLVVETPAGRFAADWVIVTNGRHYGGAFELDSGSSLFEPELAAIVIEAPSRLALARRLLRLARGNLLKDPKVKRIVGAEFTLRPLNGGRVALQADGDAKSILPVKIDICRDPVRFIAA